MNEEGRKNDKGRKRRGENTWNCEVGEEVLCLQKEASWHHCGTTELKKVSMSCGVRYYAAGYPQ
jgi:hypothetical protein